METVIRKWGNSPALRLPTAVLKEAGYQLEQKANAKGEPHAISVGL
jgi:antitoxin MazE